MGRCAQTASEARSTSGGGRRRPRGGAPRPCGSTCRWASRTAGMPTPRRPPPPRRRLHHRRRSPCAQRRRGGPGDGVACVGRPAGASHVPWRPAVIAAGRAREAPARADGTARLMAGRRSRIAGVGWSVFSGGGETPGGAPALKMVASVGVDEHAAVGQPRERIVHHQRLPQPPAWWLKAEHTLNFGAARGGLLGPRRASKRLRLRSGVRRSGLGRGSHQTGAWGGVVTQGRR